MNNFNVFLVTEKWHHRQDEDRKNDKVIIAENALWRWKAKSRDGEEKNGRYNFNEKCSWTEIIRLQ